MDPQVEPFIQTIDQLHDDIYRAVAPLTDAEINWRYPHLSTTIGILMRHITGSERYRTVQNGTERYSLPPGADAVVPKDGDVHGARGG